MATHTQFHNESAESANASGDAIDEFLHTPSLQEPGFAAAIATDAGYSQLRWLTARAIAKHAETSHDAEIGQVIEFMTTDKSNDWSDEISTLEDVERELVALREKVARLESENQTFTANVGAVDDVVLMGQYAKLGRFVAISLGANEEWDNNDLTEDVAQLWIRLGGTPQLSDDNTALPHWRKLADQFGVSHDGEDDEEELCAEDDCDNSLDDGEGYDGYCGEHADQREAAGEYGHDDHLEVDVDEDGEDRLCGCGARHAVHTDDQEAGA